MIEILLMLFVFIGTLATIVLIMCGRQLRNNDDIINRLNSKIKKLEDEKDMLEYWQKGG